MKTSTHRSTHHKASDQNRVNQGLLYLIATVEPQVQGPGALCPRALRLGPRPFSISVVNSFEGNFVWRHLYSRINFKQTRAAALAEWRQLLSA